MSLAHALHHRLERLYQHYNRWECARRDPVVFVHRYGEPLDREVAGMVAAFLAYGQLSQIMQAVGDALGRLGNHPRRCLLDSTPQRLHAVTRGFVHRVVNADRLWRLLWGMKGVLEAHGSLQSCFRHYDDPQSATVLAGVTGLAQALRAGGAGPDHLVADPAKGSACKRWMMLLRWMVRSDAVDPGGWQDVSPARLIVPLDTHLWRICNRLGMAKRRTCDLKAALQITAGFRSIEPGDPVRYDFALMHASADGVLESYLGEGLDSDGARADNAATGDGQKRSQGEHDDR